LQVSGILEVRPGPTGSRLFFRNEKARRLAEARVRLRM
jgi:hypothetical protein